VFERALTVIDVDARIIVLALVGLAVALYMGRDLTGRSVRRHWAPTATLGVAVMLLVPTLAVLVDQTRHFVAWDLQDAGSATFRPPPMSEQAVEAIQQALGAGDTWAVVTPQGRCADNVYAYYWLSFRLVPNVPDCDDPDLTLLWEVPPAPTATRIVAGESFAVVRE
jgi:hypothetical protein